MRVSTAFKNRLFRTGAGGSFFIRVFLGWVLLPPAVGADSLLCTAEDGRLGAVQTLVDSRTVWEQDNHGRNALWYACSKGYLEVARLLSEAGCPLEEPDRYGVTPLVVSVRRGYTPIVRALLDAGVSPNVEPGAPFIPLNVALVEDRVDVVFALLAAVADPLIERVSGDPATDLVRGAMLRSRLRGIAATSFLFLGSDEPAYLQLALRDTISGTTLDLRDSSGALVVHARNPGPIVPPAVKLSWDLKGGDGRTIEPGTYRV